MVVVPLRSVAHDLPSPSVEVVAPSAVAAPVAVLPGRGVALVAEVAAAHAAQVDKESRFPHESMTALREQKLLGSMIPIAHGGQGWSVRQVAAACCKLARSCSSTAMVYAMHQIQVACLVAHHGNTPGMLAFLAKVADEQLLLASVTSEAGVGGEVRRSQCAVTLEGDRVRFGKAAPSISYGRFADGLLVTARRNVDAEPSDQVMVVVERADYALKQLGTWDALGMRGTSTEAFELEIDTRAAQIMPTPFSVVASDTMLPVSHLLWCALWIGIAADAVDRARAFLRKQQSREGVSGGPGVARFAEAVERLALAQARVNHSLDGYSLGVTADSALPLIRTADVNSLKSSISDICLGVAQSALSVCGFSGYRNDTPYSVGRHLRDLNSSVLMVHNDRVREGTGRLLLARLPELGIV